MAEISEAHDARVGADNLQALVTIHFRAALQTALVAFLLCIPIVALKTSDAPGGLILQQRWGLVAILVFVTFLARLFIDVFRATSNRRIRTGMAIAAVIAICATLVIWRWPEIITFVETGGGSGRSIMPILTHIAICIAAMIVLRGLMRAAGFGGASPATSTKTADDTVPPTSIKIFGLDWLRTTAIWALGPALAIFAFTLPWSPFSDRYIMDLAILVLTYVMLGWGLNIVVGLAGLLDLGYVAFYAVGAYSYALLAQHFGFSFWICLPLAGILAAFWGIILGFPVLRLRGDYLAIVTLAFGEIIRVVLLNWYEFTGGPDGLSNIPRPSFFGLEFSRFPKEGTQSFHTFFGLEYSSLHRIIFLYYIILLLAFITNLVTIRLRRLPIGRAWEAMREDEIACKSLGINTVTTKLSAFAIGAMFGGIAGSFFATKQGFISPESFVFLESAIILAIVVLGGMGSQIGVAIAAILLIGGLEYLRDVGFLNVLFGKEFDPKQWRMVIFGALMVAVMVWRPRGLIGNRSPTIVLKEHKTISSEHVQEGHG
ncbi:MAG TPA: high-affinity branched-chain amino acid ABC transporter permease LivM [Hyphomicrobiaceae bacterium]|nr:high-affinity branched-chain amino acid ABC transporter permease LivM [Hyphomicrobiaceae bacterium]